MDFNDFIAELNEKFGMADDEWNVIRKSAIVAFDYDDRGNVSGRHKGMVVYRNKKYENEILPGETWICTLEQNPQTGMNYFAKPLKRIDASFMFELKRDQLSEVADCIWNKYRESIEPVMEERHGEKVKAEIINAVGETRSEYESRINEASAKVQELELKDIENRNIISSLQGKLSGAEQAGARGAPPLSAFGAHPDVSVRRVGPDTVASESFVSPRYSVYLSPDYRTLVLVPNTNGDVVCIDGMMTLEGLNAVSPFQDQYDMVCEYSSHYGGVMVHLKDHRYHKM